MGTGVRGGSRLLAVVAAMMLIGGCSSDGSSNDRSAGSTAPAATVVDRPDGPAATATEIEGTPFLLSPTAGPDLDEAGYVEAEYAVSGQATAYAQTDGSDTFPEDGHIELEPTTTADYTTRIVVRRPEDPAGFDGTVVMEWHNVSGGLDVAPDWTYTAAEITRSGHAWVGVSTQMIGIEGGPVAVETPVSALGGAGEGIKNQKPDRYGDLVHPGDAYSYDIFTQVARLLRDADAEVRPLGDLQAEHLLAMGESQSAYALTTYYDGVQPLTGAFDGFLVHSRGAAALELGSPGEATDITSAVTSTDPVRFRTDLHTPVIVVEAETDLVGILGYVHALQPDDEYLRTWPIAGTAHVDVFQLGPVADSFGCTEPINAGPNNFVVAAALAALTDWVTDDVAPPEAPPMQITDDEDDFERDEHGIAKGGIRTPLVDVPVDVLSGLPSEGGDVACFLAGQTTPIPDEDLAGMYPDRQAYLEAYEAATDEAIEAGFVLEADREALLEQAQPERIPG